MIAAFKDNRFIFFILALVVYASVGSSTPDNPGWPEFIILLLLIGSIGPANLLNAVRLPPGQKAPWWRLSAWILLLYSIFVPLIVALIEGADLALILRDVIGLLFLCLPLFLYGFLKNAGSRPDLYLQAILLIALIFSLRVLFFNSFFHEITLERLYLANSPLVLFAALFLISTAAQKLFNQITARHFILALVYLALSAVTLTAMFIDVQRATFIACVLTILSLLAIGFIKAPIRVIFPVLFASALGAFFYPYISNVIDDIILKTAQVGLNMRAQEFQAVWKALGQSPVHMIFGYGWGSSFASPAVGGLQVTYTHSLLTYMFLKTGLIGLFLCLAYLFFIFEKLVRLYLSDPVKGNALMWPLLIPVFFYASYKSFDFGLLLTLILVMASVTQNKQQTAELT